MNDKRPSWEQWAMRLAIEASSRSGHPNQSERVGACGVSKDRVDVFIGYNNPPSGIEIDWLSADRKTKVIHAEVNALRSAKYGEIDFMAVTMRPCIHCLTHLAGYGIKRIIYLNEYDKEDGAKQTATELGIELIKLKNSAE